MLLYTKLKNGAPLISPRSCMIFTTNYVTFILRNRKNHIICSKIACFLTLFFLYSLLTLVLTLFFLTNNVIFDLKNLKNHIINSNIAFSKNFCMYPLIPHRFYTMLLQHILSYLISETLKTT